MGLKFLVKEPHRLPQMNAVFCPEGVDEAEVRKTLLEEFSLEIGAGPRAAQGENLAFRHHGLLVPARQRHALLGGARLGALRHGPCRCTWATPRPPRTRRMPRCTRRPRSSSSRRRSAPQRRTLPPRRGEGWREVVDPGSDAQACGPLRRRERQHDALREARRSRRARRGRIGARDPAASGRQQPRPRRQDHRRRSHGGLRRRPTPRSRRRSTCRPRPPSSRRSATVRLGIRIGFHAGPVLEERGDVFGDAVNTAARMAGLAKCGQIIT